METFLIKALQLIASLSLLVFIHEFGHFMFARLFKVRVEKFYLFFNPWFSLFKFKPKNSDTEYGIGWLPLGGYVKIAGMIDESMDKEQLKEPAKPWEFRSKPAWQRLLIMIGGVMMNVLLAIFIYSMILYTWGDAYVPAKNVKLGMEYCNAAQNIGFQKGDILLSADGIEINRYDDKAVRQIVEAGEVTVMRNGKEEKIIIPAEFMQEVLKGKQPFASERFPMVIHSTVKGSAAEGAGILPNDSVIAFNGIGNISVHDIVASFAENKGQNVALTVSRNGNIQDITVPVDTLGKIGIMMKSPIELYDVVMKDYSVIEAIPAGISKGVAKLTGYVSDMKYVFTKEGAQSVGGFATIGSIFPTSWNWLAFWEITAFLSLALAFMNIIPIPALDGGHVMFLFYEMITGRQPNEKFMEYAQMAGMIFLFGLMLYANGMDVFRFFTK
ncbi:MAG: RIP metalloprotease RseP [Bacteroidales bacterium]